MNNIKNNNNNVYKRDEELLDRLIDNTNELISFIPRIKDDLNKIKKNFKNMSRVFSKSVSQKHDSDHKKLDKSLKFNNSNVEVWGEGMKKYIDTIEKIYFCLLEFWEYDVHNEITYDDLLTYLKENSYKTKDENKINYIRTFICRNFNVYIKDVLTKEDKKKLYK